MEIKILEGEVKNAKCEDTIKYPSVTSCITVTCFDNNGEKWGAHLSLFTPEKGKPHKILLQDLRSLMSTSGRMGHIKKVCVVGVLSCWNVDFGPAINEAGRPDPNAITDSKYVKCSGNLLNYLGLQRLKSGDVVFRETEDGDLIAESGLNFQVSGG